MSLLLSPFALSFHSDPERKSKGKNPHFAFAVAFVCDPAGISFCSLSLFSHPENKVGKTAKLSAVKKCVPDVHANQTIHHNLTTKIPRSKAIFPKNPRKND
jgi:hypothetical protein